MTSSFKLALLVCMICLVGDLVHTQRSLFLWKRDLEHRLKLYDDQRDTIDKIIASSIISSQIPIGLINKTHGSPNRPTFVADKVRFTDLIVPNGSLHLESSTARLSVQVMLNKTNGYIGSKMSDLYQIKSNLGELTRRLNESRNSFIYKGSKRWPNQVIPLYHNATKIRGSWQFKQIGHIHMINSDMVELNRINNSDVNHVLRETYMENPRLRLEDSQGRLFFEGKKTFWNTVFLADLRSGCCDRLKPLHTDRMMLRSYQQDVSAPVLLINDVRGAQDKVPVFIRRLNSGRISNRDYRTIPRAGQPFNPVETSIMPNSVIKLQDYVEAPEIQKTIVFTGIVNIEQATLNPSPLDNRLAINILGFNNQNNSSYLRFPIEHDNYLLRFYPGQQQPGGAFQHIRGPVIVDGEATFDSAIIPIESVNNVPDFAGFLSTNIVRIDRPALVRGPMRFGSINSFNYPQMVQEKAPLPSSELIRVRNWLNVSGLINGMRWPQDLLVKPLHPEQVLHLRGPRSFTGSVKFKNHLTVRGRVAGLLIPNDIIPLHMDDPYLDYGPNSTALLFVDGIDARYLTVQSGRFDDINLNDVNDEPSFILRSMTATQPDGSLLIRAPLRVQNLHLYGSNAHEGLLNGFKPHQVLELRKDNMYSQQQYITPIISGRKTFLRPVEVADCKFDTINDVHNWTNQLIRIDRPIAQAIYSKLAFVQPQSTNLTDSYAPFNKPVVHIDNLKVEYETENDNQAIYARNWNFSPELYIINQALARSSQNYTRDRYRVTQQIRLLPQDGRLGRVNNVDLNDIVTLNQQFRFDDRYVMVGKVDVGASVQADRIRSNYPIDRMDLTQFAKFRVPLWTNTPARLQPIRLNNLVLMEENRAQYVQAPLVNGLMLNQFVNTTMSLTRPQVIDNKLIFRAPVNFEAVVRTQSSLNGIKHFRDFIDRLQQARYVFEDGFQCHAVVLSAGG